MKNAGKQEQQAKLWQSQMKDNLQFY